MTEERPKPPIAERLRERRERHLQRGLVYRGFYVVAGVTVLLCGIALIVLPGPALVVIPIGLAMLALEFAWAERLLAKAIEKAEAAKQAAESRLRASRTGADAGDGRAGQP
jgi:uncharacterized protein (TIGR02611 family)